MSALPESLIQRKRHVKIPPKQSSKHQSLSKPPKRNKSTAPRIDGKLRKHSVASSGNESTECQTPKFKIIRSKSVENGRESATSKYMTLIGQEVIDLCFRKE